MSNLDTLTARRSHLATQERALQSDLEQVIALPADADSVARGEKIVGELEELRSELGELDARIGFLKEHQQRVDNSRRTPIYGTRSRGTSEARSAVLRNLASLARFADDRVLDAATKIVESKDGEDIAREMIARSHPDYHTAFLKLMRDPVRGHLEFTAGETAAFAAVREQQRLEEQRAMSVGTNSAGGFAVPYVLDPSIVITGAGSINPMRQIATVKTVPVGNYHGITGGQISASWDTEASAVSDDSPTLTSPSIPAYLGRAFIPVSFEAFNDVADLAGEVSKLMADAKDNLEADAHWVGTGTGQPKGVVTAVTAVTASRVTPATGGAYVLGDAFKTQNALPARHSKRASWASNIAVINANRQLAMAQNSANSVWTDLGQDQPAGFLGRGYYEAPAMASTLTTGNNILLYGDFAKYYVVDVVGSPTMEFLPNLIDTATGRPTSQRGFMLWFRQGGDVVDADAFRILKL